MSAEEFGSVKLSGSSEPVIDEWMEMYWPRTMRDGTTQFYYEWNRVVRLEGTEFGLRFEYYTFDTCRHCLPAHGN